MKSLSPHSQGMREKRFAIMLPEEVVVGFGWAHEVPARVHKVLVMELRTGMPFLNAKLLICFISTSEISSR
jgi:hypothetical protein